MCLINLVEFDSEEKKTKHIKRAKSKANKFVQKLANLICTNFLRATEYFSLARSHYYCFSSLWNSIFQSPPKWEARQKLNLLEGSIRRWESSWIIKSFTSKKRFSVLTRWGLSFTHVSRFLPLHRQKPYFFRPMWFVLWMRSNRHSVSVSVESTIRREQTKRDKTSLSDSRGYMWDLR